MKQSRRRERLGARHRERDTACLRDHDLFRIDRGRIAVNPPASEISPGLSVNVARLNGDAVGVAGARDLEVRFHDHIGVFGNGGVAELGRAERPRELEAACEASAQGRPGTEPEGARWVQDAGA